MFYFFISYLITNFVGAEWRLLEISHSPKKALLFFPLYESLENLLKWGRETKNAI